MVGNDEGVRFKEEEVEIDITDNEASSGDEDVRDEEVAGGGLKRKRTIRVVIRSRAFI